MSRIKVSLFFSLLITLGLVQPSWAEFDWGSGSPCVGGGGEFEQFVSSWADELVGTIPVGKNGVRIALESDEDVDIRLVDTENNVKIIVWDSESGHGLLHGPTEQCTTHEGVEYCYSGYNGVGDPGKEWIEVRGITNVPLRVSAFGYHAGTAQVTYSWEPSEGCVDEDKGNGAFEQTIPYWDIVYVGTIPAGKSNVDVALTADGGKDIDIQLYDGDTKVVSWPNGLINGAGQTTITYRGLRITYSGYNGRDGNWGKEDLRISGTLESDLTVKVFGYQSGFADVVYSWGHGVSGDGCGGFTSVPNHSCRAGLICQYSEATGDVPGTCVYQLTVDELAASAQTYDEKMVAVGGQIVAGPTACTKMFCSPSNPCCNNCRSQLFLESGSNRVMLDGLNCVGNSCSAEESPNSWENQCAHDIGSYAHVVGTAKATTASTFQAQIEVTDNNETTACYLGGCSSQLCTPNEGVISTCEWLEEYTCLPQTTCGHFGPMGSCGFRQSEEYEECLSAL